MPSQPESLYIEEMAEIAIKSLLIYETVDLIEVMDKSKARCPINLSQALRIHLRYLFAPLLLLASQAWLHAQDMFFKQLGNSDGLTATSFWHAAIDKNGFAWLASQDGLYTYDGYNITHYTQETYPQLPSNTIGYLYCDSRNRVWIQTSRGIAVMDEQRRLQTINIPGYQFSNTLERMVFEAPGKGMVAISPGGCFISNDGLNDWQPYPWLTEILKGGGAVDTRRFNDQWQLLSVRNKRILLLDFKTQRVILDLPLTGALGVCRLNEDEILAGTDGKWDLFRISISQKKIVQQYETPKDKRGNLLMSGVVMMDKAADGSIYISTRRNGLIRFNPGTGKFDHFSHDAMNIHSINDNGLKMVVTNDEGLLLATSSGGVNFTNVLYPTIAHNLFFRDGRGQILDVAVNSMSTKGNNVYVTCPTHIIRWDRSTGVSHILKDLTGERTAAQVSIPSCVETDPYGNIWVGTTDDGILVFDDHDKIFKHLNKELPSASIRSIKRLENGMMMVGSERGLFMIQPRRYTLDTFASAPALQSLLKKRIVDIYQNGDDLWIAVSPNGGAYHYNFRSGKIKLYNEQSGMSTDRAYCITADKLGNTYVGTFNGLNIIHNGQVETIDKRNGLLNTRVESIEVDDNGYVWFTNNSTLCRYDPLNKKIAYFNEQNGITSSGFGVESSHRSASGELFFGTSKGLIHFMPGNIHPYSNKIRLGIESTTDGRTYLPYSKDNLLQFHKEGKVSFRISGSDIINNRQLYYRYKMEHLDTGWSEPSRDRSIAYNLEPGKYRFIAQASFDRSHYVATAETVSITVSKPFTQTWYFRAAMMALVIAGISWFAWHRINSLRKKLQVQKQMADLEARALRAQMNPHFIFNSLNAIQECIVAEKIDEAYEYLSKFSKLMRMVLSNSEKNLIPLSKELEMLQLYLSLESLRFKKAFSYSLVVDEELDLKEVMIPPLLIQPYIENALWHGLRLKEGKKILSLHFRKKEDQLLVEIEDNGIGRKRSFEINKAKLGTNQFESKGTLLTQQRIEMMNRQYHFTAYTETIDLVDEQNEPTGTKVVLHSPLDLAD